ncbi:MAG TPA: hypothetical protein VFH88_05090, partial [Candidatus Krumholzibacteria bacterium]|nr:hypothetical protein [Candidatus Krumholzibacteria bacterium]
MDSNLKLEALCEAGLPAGEATSFLAAYLECVKGLPRNAAWQRVSRDVLGPDHPHAVHRLCWDDVFMGWN